MNGTDCEWYKWDGEHFCFLKGVMKDAYCNPSNCLIKVDYEGYRRKYDDTEDDDTDILEPRLRQVRNSEEDVR